MTLLTWPIVNNGPTNTLKLNSPEFASLFFTEDAKL